MAKTIFLKNFEALCEEHGESCRAVLIKLGIAKSAIAAWRKGSLPNMTTLNKIANYFTISINTLMGLDDGEYNSVPLSEDTEHLVRLFNRACEADRKAVELILSKYEKD